ncbi:MAG: glycosyltransferase family 4 protein [Gammaproteobacteria bacterium]|jgi:glycosyltransferase involved in cell wall biosynthesis
MAKILFVDNYLKSLVSFRGALIKAFINKKFEVVVSVPPLADDPPTHTIEEMGGRVVYTPMNNASINPIADLRYIITLYRLMKQEKCEYVFACRIKPVLYGGMVARILKVPNVYAIITGAGFAMRNQSGKYYFLHQFVCFLYRYALGSMKTVFFQNIDDRDLFVANQLVKKEKTQIVAGSGIDLNEYPLTPMPHKISFLFAARLVRDKGIVEYVKAARILKKQYPQIQFKVAGEIHLNPTSITQEELDAWINEGIIEYLGMLPSLHKVLAESSVFVLPSYHEGVSRAALEALAMGRAIVTTDAPGCKETVEQGVNGYLVPIKNAEQLADAMKNFIENPMICEEMGQKSRKLAEEKFDVNKVNEEILHTIAN